MRKHNRHIVITLLIIIVIGVIVGFELVRKKVTPVMMITAEEECRKLSSIIINDAIKKQVVDGLNFDKLFIITYEQDKIATIDFDSVIVNKVLSTITSTVQNNIKYLEEGNISLLEVSDNILAHYDQDKLRQGIIYEIPLGLVYNHPFLSNLSPKVPVRINLVGSIDSGIKTKVTSYGINNVLVEAYVDVEVNLRVVLPFQSHETKVTMSVPLALKMIRGEVPEYYANGVNGPTVSLPIS